ncbi:MAG: hypothetical protein HY913_00585 [Desulfomonile tiedjei]|nr:hypothetical protein [Desulfomonile tiedjei]
MEPTRTITFDQVESLYERARFLYAEKKAALAPYWPEIQETWTKLLASEDGIFRFNYKSKADSLSSSICIAQYCDRTWMIQHAVGVHDPGGVLGNLLDVCQWAVDNPRCDHVRFLYRPTNKWPNLIFGQLMPKLREGSYEHHVYHYYTGNLTQAIPLNSRAGLSIEYLEPAEYKNFEFAAEKHHSSLLIDSKGLRASDISMQYASRKYALVGLTRQREILVARQDGQIIGYSAMDCSSLGINLSFLLNAFTPTMFTEDPVAEQNLVAGSVNHYLAKGRRFVVGLSESDNQISFTNAGLNTTKQYAEMIIATEGNFARAVEHFRDYYQGIGVR